MAIKKIKFISKDGSETEMTGGGAVFIYIIKV